MARTLGLDLGTNSIGWMLVEDGKRIIDSGVRIFPIGVQEEDFRKQGKEISKNVARRTARGIRRRYHRYKLRRDRLMQILSEHKMLPDAKEFLTTRELYLLRSKGLDEELSLTQFGRILMMLNKRRGFKSNRKMLSTEDVKKEEGVVKEAILELQQEIDKNKCRTVGEYFALLFKQTEKQKKWHNEDEPMQRIRDRFVGREMYEREFDELWKKQSEFHRNVLTEELRILIKEKTIYYQRNLKSQKRLVGKCRFEPSKRCAPKSSPLFQEFRIWQQLASFRFANTERVGQGFTPQEKQLCFAVAAYNKKLTHAEIKKILGLSRTIKFNDVPDIIGNTTYARIGEAVGQDFFRRLTDNQKNELWHILTYTDSTKKIYEIVKRKITQDIIPALNEEAIEQYAEVILEDGYGNFSSRALKKILPHLRQGLPPYDAFLAAGYDPTKKYTWGKIEERTEIPPLVPNELRNPIVQQMLGEAFRIVNAIVKKHGKPDMIRAELARELKKPKTKREEDRFKSIQKRKLREEFSVFLSSYLKRKITPNAPEVRKYELWLEMGCENPKLDNLETFLKNGRIIDQKKYKLWKECGRISPYSGKVISLSKLFSPDIQIEHIWPYSKTMDSEFTNLCLCEASINKDKGDMLPYEYFSSKGEKALALFKERVSIFKGKKRHRFLSNEIPPDFLNSQLNNTRYAARELASRLEVLLPPIKDGETFKPRVQVINGQATAILRQLWGLNSILSHGDVDTKNRGDHRHHAIDALVIACTTPSLVHSLSTYSKFDALNKLTNKKIEEPWKHFLKDAEYSIMSIVVSYKNQKRLVAKKPNKIKERDLNKYPEGWLRQSTITIRGPLHEETNYGAIKINNELTFVTRWPLQKFTNVKQLEKVVDNKVKEILLKRVKKYKGDVKKAFAENLDDPLEMYSKKGLKIPIKRVRVVNPSENLVPIRPTMDKNKFVYVETGNNYCIAIYEDSNSHERDFETITFFEATRRALSHEQIIKGDLSGKPLLFTLQQLDTIVLYDNHPDEIEWNNIDYLRPRLFRIRKFDVNGIIYLDYLYAANIDEKEDRNRLFYQKSPNTLNCVKVRVNPLGQITKDD